jgi:hypothetical protein
MGYEWLPEVLAILRGVEPYEVMQALRAEHRWPRPVIGPDGVALLTIWARTTAGRRLIVVTRSAGTFDSWIVGAREMNPAEAAEYDRWEATR